MSPRATADPAAEAVAASAAAAPDWTALAAAARGCVACPPLAASRTRVVVGTAPPGATTLLVGEAPGAAEDAAGLPFVGRSGRLLDELLAEAGLHRDAVAVLNVLKCRPPGNRAPTAAETRRCTGWLDRQVALLAPQRILALGTSAAGWALGRGTRLADSRGRWHALHGTGPATLVSYHPSAALRFGRGGLPMAGLRSDLALLAAGPPDGRPPAADGVAGERRCEP